MKGPKKKKKKKKRRRNRNNPNFGIMLGVDRKQSS
jgi:hypothetical protein